MKLINVKLKNYRCYSSEVAIPMSDLTCLIGKNDIGKSSVLEAIGAFFNDDVDKEDLSTDSSTNTIEITCEFDDVPDSIILDSSIETTFADEYLLNDAGRLEVKKTYKIGKTISKGTYILAKHPEHPKLLNILSLKNSALKSLASEVDADLNGVPKSKNPPLRKAIRDTIDSELAMVELKVDGSLDSEDNLKVLWKSIKKALPVYSLFKVDKSLDDKDKDIQDPMKIAIKESLAIPRIMEMLQQIEEEVKKTSSEVAEKTLEKLKEIDYSLAEKMKSEFGKDPGWDKVFDLTLLNEKDIPLNKRGSGVRRLVLLSFFQAQAERKKIDDGAPSIIYAIEEPETSQHPNHQKILIESLQNLSNREDLQIVFTTHSSNLVKEIPIESLRYIYTDESGDINIESAVSEQTEEENESVISAIIKTLGILPNPTDMVRVLLFVEGNHDVNALKEYSRILNEYDPEVISLVNNQRVGMVISGGSSLKFYIDNKYLEGLGKPEVHIYDNDVPEYRASAEKVNADTSGRKKAFITSKLEIENYLYHEAIKEAYEENGTSVTIPEIDDRMDVPLTVAKAVYEATTDKNWEDLRDEKKKKKIANVKKMLNANAVEKMTIDRMKTRESYNEIKDWLTTLKVFSDL
jgi:putative ATP-dependent endonuclease of the OLD family